MEILQRKEMRQLNQRITVRYHLQPMDFQDTVHYINHRLKVAGGKGSILFSRGALKRIYRYSRGLPRLINAACDRALLAGYTKDATGISSRIAAVGIKSIGRNTVSGSRRRRLILVPTFGVLAALFAGGFYFARRDLIGPFNGPQRVEDIKGAEAIATVDATEEQTEKESILAGEDLSRLMAKEIGKVPERESVRRAFNTLAGLWNVPPAPEGDALNQFNGMERAALNRDLCFYRFSGNLGALLRIDYPAALEVTLPGIPGKRFVSLVGKENEQLLIDPPIAGKKSISPSEVERYWSGQGFLLWKDPLNLLSSLSVGSRGRHIKRLQELLKEAGATRIPLTGVYDDDTHLAVKEFQASKGIGQDGIVGSQTLMVLYRSIDRFEVPTLTVGRR
jgi:general secretion pathway protein A